MAFISSMPSRTSYRALSSAYLLLEDKPALIECGTSPSVSQVLEALNPRHLYFSHFGVNDAIAETFAESRRKLQRWGEVARRAMQESDGWGHVYASLHQHVEEELGPLRAHPELYEYFLRTSLIVAAQGYYHYFDRLEA